MTRYTDNPDADLALLTGLMGVEDPIGLSVDHASRRTATAAIHGGEWRRVPAPAISWTADIPEGGDRFTRWEALGFQFDRDSLEEAGPEAAFVRMRLPDGWTYRSTPGDLFPKIADERGVIRAGMTDNGQWWDRYANLHFIGPHMYATYAIYGDQPIPWELFTDREIVAVATDLLGEIAKGETPLYADIHKDSLPKAVAALESCPLPAYDLLAMIEASYETATYPPHRTSPARHDGDLLEFWVRP